MDVDKPRRLSRHSPSKQLKTQGPAASLLTESSPRRASVSLSQPAAFRQSGLPEPRTTCCSIRGARSGQTRRGPVPGETEAKYPRTLSILRSCVRAKVAFRMASASDHADSARDKFLATSSSVCFWSVISSAVPTSRRILPLPSRTGNPRTHIQRASPFGETILNRASKSPVCVASSSFRSTWTRSSGWMISSYASGSSLSAARERPVMVS